MREKEEPDFPEGCAIVFGGSGGLGAGISELLARRGSDVAVTYYAHRESAEKVKAAIDELGRRATIIQCDVTIRSSVERAFVAAKSDLGRIHTVISAGGIEYELSVLSEVTEHGFRNAVETDVFGFFNLAQLAVRHMRNQGGGSIVAVTTCGTDMMIRMNAMSSMPKIAVSRMARHLAAEEGKYGIRVNCVGAGLIYAGLNTRSHNDPEKMRIYNQVLADMPLGREGTAREYAEAIVFLASARASYVTGQVLHCDGGMSA